MPAGHHIAFDGCVVKRKSGKALLLDIEGEEAWIPYSQLQDDSTLNEDSNVGDIGDIVIPVWLAQEKDLM